MREKDATLQYWSEQISSLSAEYERAKLRTSYLHDQMDSAWQSLHDLQQQYREYKEQANYEFEQAQYCWSMNDRASAKAHSENGHILNQRKADLGASLDAAHARYDPIKSQFDEAVAYQRSIKAQLDQARNAHKLRIEELKAQNIQEQLHWKEKSCGRCGAAIRYRDTWDHIPNYCKSCKEIMKAEREEREKKRAAEAAKWKEKPCKQCGKPIRYNVEWSHFPNFCSECKEEFAKKKQEKQSSQSYKLRFNMVTGKNDFYFGTDSPRPGDGHGHVVIGDDGQVHYVRDQYDPKSKTDRKDSISYDDGYFFK